ASGQTRAADELPEGSGDLTFDAMTRVRSKQAAHRARDERTLSHPPASRDRHFGLDGTPECTLSHAHRLDIVHAIGGVVECLAFGGDPGHLVALREQSIVVLERGVV